MVAEEESKLDYLLGKEEGLTTWELEFIERLDKVRHRPLTEAQAEKLEEIYVSRW